MKLGMPTMIEKPDLRYCAGLCRELGLDFIELNMNFPEYLPQNIDISLFRETAAEHGIFYTLHLDDAMNVADLNPYVAKAYLRTVRESVLAAEQLRMPLINLHLSMGAYYTLPEKKVYLFDVYKQEYLNNIRTFRTLCEDTIGSGQLKICVENCGGYSPIQQEALDMLLESPVFALTMDIGHNACAGQVDEPFIFAHADRLHHMHAHDTRGSKDHLALGDGEMNAKKYLDLARERNCTVVLETKTIAGLGRSVRWMQENAYDEREMQ